MRNEGTESMAVSYRAIPDTRAKTPLSAAARLRQGKILITAGAITAILGVAVYCTTIFVAEMNNEPVRFLREGLMLIGTGLAVWVVGAIRYLNAAIDIGHTDDSI